MCASRYRPMHMQANFMTSILKVKKLSSRDLNICREVTFHKLTTDVNSTQVLLYPRGVRCNNAKNISRISYLDK